MNCPCHVQIFNQSLMSYRDLPRRMAEFDHATVMNLRVYARDHAGTGLHTG